MKCPQHYLTEIQEVVLFYNGLDVPTRQILDSRGAKPSKTTADAKVAIQEMVEYSQKWHNGTSRTRSPYYTKDYPLKEEGKTLEEAYYTQFGAPFHERGYRATALGFYQRNNMNPSYQERRQSMEDTLSKFMSESTKRHEENSKLIKEIRASMDAAIRNQGASIKTLEIQIGQMSKVLQERGFGSLPSSTETNPRDHVKSISTIIEADSYPICRMRSSQYVNGSYGPQFSEAYSEASHINNSIPRKEKDPGSFTLPYFINNVCFDNSLVDLGASVSVMPLSTYLNLGLGELAHTKLSIELADRIVKYPKGIAENMLLGIGKFVFPIYFIILDMPEEIKVPLILGRPFLSTIHAKIDVFKRRITLRVREEKIIFKSVKPASSLIKRVYMLSLRERIELDLEVRLIRETLVLNRSLDPLFEDYIELNDLNVPLELRRDQVDDLMSTIEEGEVIKEFRARNDASMVSKVFGYPSDCDYDKKICIDCAYNLKFSCMIGQNRFKGNNVVGALMNIPIFVGTFSILTYFIVLEDMDAYRDEGMSDVIFGEPFLREVRINTKRFERMITIHNGNEEVIYQMARSHLRFKNHANEECNKIPPLLKVSEEDKMNEISHSYQKLNGFYKGVLNLGPEYVRDAKMEEWLTRGHINDLAERKEIENVGGESTIWKSGSVRVLKSQDGELAHTKLSIELADKIVKYPKGIAENMLLELRRDQVDDLMLTIEEGEVKFLEDMDAYRDEGMSDVIFGEPFLREVRINTKRFERMITIHNGNEEVTYQMARSHPRTSQKEKKSRMLVENLRSGNLEVLES
ncbi:mitochondrial proton/calcium exchanger protein-like protein isoform X1 [Tanacetum coccineum]